MPDQRSQTAEPRTRIRTPDQLQQAKRPDAPRDADVRDAATSQKGAAGVLGQLQTERAHD